MNNLLLIVIILSSYCFKSEAQRVAPFYRVGLEVGGSTSTFVPKTTEHPPHNQRLGVRLGVYSFHRIFGSLDLKIGIFYNLRGSSFAPPLRPNSNGKLLTINNISIPFMLFWNISDRVNLAVGVEVSDVVSSNFLWYNRTSWGLIGSCGFYVAPRCRVAAYYVHELTPLYWNVNSFTRAAPIVRSYFNIVAGISVSYDLHKKYEPFRNAPDFRHPCPRLVQQSPPIHL